MGSQTMYRVESAAWGVLRKHAVGVRGRRFLFDPGVWFGSAHLRRAVWLVFGSRMRIAILDKGIKVWAAEDGIAGIDELGPGHSITAWSSPSGRWVTLDDWRMEVERGISQAMIESGSSRRVVENSPEIREQLGFVF